MADSNRDRINPSLLDRLTDEAPGTPAARGAGSLTLSDLRKGVLRDLNWLFNTARIMSAEELDAWPQVRNSVLNYGLPPLSGVAASGLDISKLERALRQAILDFEPRILPETIEVKAIADVNQLDRHNIIGIQIRGQLWAQPVPLEMLIRTEIDLETGKVNIADLAPTRVS